ncbi:alpha/beta-hydrolase [Polychaeton citri CBS 116435]|uniref:Alpha/beta-hydrolase n=1 Tax=Polychaeton citri CBS 116435 TaxID=1314669 RepID=A0A9P4USH4_9PEZI|nr:alpha/beta-hydrolase [Polychaeton citri CBS 116435]
MAQPKEEVYDHTGQPVHHGRYRVNGIRMHAITAGSGPPLLLLHGTPKDSFYFYRLFPLLTPHFSLVAPDLRGCGYSDKPPAAEGYDCKTAAQDLTELMDQLGHREFHIHGEDRGAEYGYALAATLRDRVKSLSFCEMLLSGLGLEETSFWTKGNVTAQYEQRGAWCWHLSFFYVPHIPEMLIQGHEREFWEIFMKQECFDPTAIEPRALDHWVECCKQPGGTRGVLETYRAGLQNGEQNLQSAKEKLTCPVMTVAAPDFFGPLVAECARKFASNVTRSEVFEECGHPLALEKPERLAQCLVDFIEQAS